ncbi:peroxiredoxin family protein [Caenibacillus caldisaponilyticus]|uniref:peroxiredoxin family protein n=1 Tax=Caenibacillus caldisaponilyticus TaxID=1674942 RepID=UPI000988625B|nr:TlpA disulfide reductase family protein [Caenibacillus caldisaponilyticus]
MIKKRAAAIGALVLLLAAPPVMIHQYRLAEANNEKSPTLQGLQEGKMTAASRSARKVSAGGQANDEKSEGGIAGSSDSKNGGAEDGWIGRRAPDFELTGMDGKKVRLSDYRGKKVVLNFWTTWCPPCKEEMPLLAKFYDQAARGRTELLAVNITAMETGGAGALKPFIARQRIAFPVLLDTRSEVSEKYGVLTIPTTYVIDESGHIAALHIGPVTEAWLKQVWR